MNRYSCVLSSLILFLSTGQLCAQQAIWPQNGTVYDNKIHRIDIFLPKDSWVKMNNNVWDNIYFRSLFIYDQKDSVIDIGMRVKGNSSRNAEKKSYRLDLAGFKAQTYQGLKNMNLNGNQNDPSAVREYLSARFLARAGIVSARCNPVELYVNGTFQGLRNHAEYIDKTFLDSRFGESSGNLYKCSWPADLGWLGASQQPYKDLINPSPLNERAYDLKTNTVADDYSDLVYFINVINNSPKDSFAVWIEQVFDVNAYLKVLAAEVLMGHWDNYFYNKNNYFLYHRMSDNRFVYIPYDMDNTFGVQWGVSDIQKRNIHSWGNLSSSKAPLTYKILNITKWKMAYEQELRNLIDGAYKTDSLFAIIDFHKTIVASSVSKDPYYNGTLTSDYGFKVSDWQQADTKAWGKHVSYGVKPFISERTTSALQQMIYPAGTGLITKNRLSIYPNPASDIVYSPVLAGKNVHIYQTNGTLIKSCNSASGEISVADLSDGTYIMELQDAVKTLLLIRH
ncbi:MAG: T9SS C-terminal target domain-containing protein [Bacteroidetes bacterium]|nr:T9SS C-terminal target domain-containing protein [Bacteroidota bacterium]